MTLLHSAVADSAELPPPYFCRDSPHIGGYRALIPNRNSSLTDGAWGSCMSRKEQPSTGALFDSRPCAYESESTTIIMSSTCTHQSRTPAVDHAKIVTWTSSPMVCAHCGEAESRPPFPVITARRPSSPQERYRTVHTHSRRVVFNYFILQYIKRIRLQ
jgi:hypothetical protein